MTPVTELQAQQIQTRIGELSTRSVEVVNVDVEEADDLQGPTVVVTVTLSSRDASSGWDADDFLEIRRKARTAAVEVLSGEDVRLVYESSTASAESESDAGGTAGAKQPKSEAD